MRNRLRKIMLSSPLYIWQNKNWPNFTYDQATVMTRLESCIQAVSPLKQLSAVLSDEQRLDWEAAILLDETLASAKIEGELYDRDSVRSSIVNKLGIGKGSKFNKQSDAMVELLSSALETHRNEYYQQLQNHQGCQMESLKSTTENSDGLDLTAWIVWFLSMVEIAALDAKKEFERVMQTTHFWQRHQQTLINIRH
ncbi:hypothetical protein CXF95_28310 [Paraglaciecola sp. MB-3u-78]|nr:hypothetical protein CXF95_28310 [Paraglaciecola sp. MB-3u-78]